MARSACGILLKSQWCNGHHAEECTKIQPLVLLPIQAGAARAGQVSALFHIASSKEPPVIPDVLSKEGRDFLLLCLNRRVLAPPAVAAPAQKHPVLVPYICMRDVVWLQRAHARQEGGVKGRGPALPDRNPKERPSAARLLRHAWLADLIPQGCAAPLTNLSVHDLPPAQVADRGLDDPCTLGIACSTPAGILASRPCMHARMAAGWQ